LPVFTGKRRFIALATDDVDRG